MSNLFARVDAWLDAAGEKLKAKNLTIPSALIGAVLFLILSIVVLLILPQQVTIKETDVVNGRAFPELLMFVMMGCATALILGQLYKLLRGEPLETTTINLLVELKALMILGIMLLFYFLAPIHFLVAALVSSLLLLLFFRCKKPLYYVITLGLVVLIYFAFSKGLNVSF